MTLPVSLSVSLSGFDEADDEAPAGTAEPVSLAGADETGADQVDSAAETADDDAVLAGTNAMVASLDAGLDVVEVAERSVVSLAVDTTEEASPAAVADADSNCGAGETTDETVADADSLLTAVAPVEEDTAASPWLCDATVAEDAPLAGVMSTCDAALVADEMVAASSRELDDELRGAAASVVVTGLEVAVVPLLLTDVDVADPRMIPPAEEERQTCSTAGQGRAYRNSPSCERIPP